MFAVLVFGVLGGIAYLAYAQARNATASDVTDVPAPPAPTGPLTNDLGVIAMIDPQDRSTWPSGDKIWTLAQAIAIAEGYPIPNSNPARLNNPGDISDGALTYGYEEHSGSKVTRFPDPETGWRWLYNKLNNAFVLNSSGVYSPAMTFLQFGQKYAGDWSNWVRNVTNDLNVDPSTRVGDWFNA